MKEITEIYNPIVKTIDLTLSDIIYLHALTVISMVLLRDPIKAMLLVGNDKAVIHPYTVSKAIEIVGTSDDLIDRVSGDPDELIKSFDVSKFITQILAAANEITDASLKEQGGT